MKKFLLGLSALIMASAAEAQDVHYTQYFASPLTLNPALSGLTREDIRATVNFRQQWASVSPNPYITGTASVDVSTLKGKLPEGDALGVGLVALFDKSGSGALQNTTVGISTAYHKSFGNEKRNTISAGVQLYLVQKTIDFTKLIFADQINLNGQIATTGENFPQADLTYPDFNAGLMYTGRINNNTTVYVGGSVYHITQPVETFQNGNKSIAARTSLFLGGSFNLNENIVLYASGLYQNQGSANEGIAGAATGFILNPGYDSEYQKATIFYLGAWYRVGDALAPYVSFEFSKLQIGISYDANLGKFTPATNGIGGYEVSLIYNGKFNKGQPRPTYNFACPKF